MIPYKTMLTQWQFQYRTECIYDQSLSQHPLYTALYGAVFDMRNARPHHEFLKHFCGGQDMTFFHLKRLDSANNRESIEDIKNGKLSSAQKKYLNNYMKEYEKEYRYVGRFEYGEALVD